jgi:hypothetical protein
MSQSRSFKFDEYLDEANPEISAPFLGATWKPSDMLWALDPIAYGEQSDAWVELRINEALGEGRPHYESNRSRYDELAAVIGRGRIVPFVGAGVSCSFGLPSWRAFLLGLAERSRIPVADVEKLLDQDEYEAVASRLADDVGTPLFREHFDHKFRIGAGVRSDGPVHTLLALASGPVLTTNYDNVIELVSGSRLAVFNGRQPGLFVRMAREGAAVLLKIHGDLNIPESTVLLTDEYETVYGRGTAPKMNTPFCQLMRAVFLSHTVLFAGCSLAKDRTMQLLRKLASEPAWSARHYAIVEAPQDEEKRRERESYLANCHIFPIWYANGEHQHLATLLDGLLHAKEGR